MNEDPIESPTQIARRICPNWQSPEGDAHYRDVLKELTKLYDTRVDMAYLSCEPPLRYFPNADALAEATMLRERIKSAAYILARDKFTEEWRADPNAVRSIPFPVTFAEHAAIVPTCSILDESPRMWSIRNGLGHEVGTVEIPAWQDEEQAIVCYAVKVNARSTVLKAAGYAAVPMP